MICDDEQCRKIRAKKNSTKYENSNRDKEKRKKYHKEYSDKKRVYTADDLLEKYGDFE